MGTSIFLIFPPKKNQAGRISSIFRLNPYGGGTMHESGIRKKTEKNRKKEKN
jgi:hypothetical protein|tara:strand:- start:1170 stop:1325 length:156 start_codon:yes stop_codon:yes gene_type:complete